MEIIESFELNLQNSLGLDIRHDFQLMEVKKQAIMDHLMVGHRGIKVILATIKRLDRIHLSQLQATFNGEGTLKFSYFLLQTCLEVH
jgi:hypothetical protein